MLLPAAQTFSQFLSEECKKFYNQDITVRIVRGIDFDRVIKKRSGMPIPYIIRVDDHELGVYTVHLSQGSYGARYYYGEIPNHTAGRVAVIGGINPRIDIDTKRLYQEQINGLPADMIQLAHIVELGRKTLNFDQAFVNFMERKRVKGRFDPHTLSFDTKLDLFKDFLFGYIEERYQVKEHPQLYIANCPDIPFP